MLALVEEHLVKAREAQSDTDILDIISSVAEKFGFRSGYIIEYVGKFKVAQLIDSEVGRSGWWDKTFIRSQVARAASATGADSGSLLQLCAASFAPLDEPALEFARRNDIVDCVVVPINHGGEIAGAACFSGAVELGDAARLALQLVSYCLFAQARSFRSVNGSAARPWLTTREKQVMQLSAEGLTANAIGDRLGIAARTANQHVDNVAHKLGTRNRTHTVAEAIRHRLL